ncbi:hypothetical protein EVA_11835 [gut metagenome]|uniref:Uncharacterized protein n=1 Tax=gut metagenome TaxID=749906 RepID=J9GK95_9ZZZZ
MGTRSTGCHHIGAFSLKSQLNGNIPCRHIRNHQRHHQRIYSGRSLG